MSKTNHPRPANDPQFNQFWALYPRKVQKTYAKACFNAALKRASFEAIMVGLRAYPFSSNPTYHPHPSTWLNGDRWAPEDNTPPPTIKLDPTRSSWRDKYDGRGLPAMPFQADAARRVSDRSAPTIEGDLFGE